MQIIKKIKNYLSVKVFLSLIGGFFIAGGYPLIGFTIWIVSNGLWLKHFYDLQDKQAVFMYWIWQIQAIYGVYYWGFLV